MIDSSVLARRCAPEASTAELTVLISDLWKWTWEAVESSSAIEGLIDHWAREKYRDDAVARTQYGLRSVVHEMLTKAFQQGVFGLRVHDGNRAWRLPIRALEGWNSGLDLEMTWTLGRLWDFEAADDFRPVAELQLPLLTSEEDAAAFRSKVLAHIKEMEARPEEVPPEASEEDLIAWIAEWSGKPRWPVREALLWVALRDLREVATVALTSAWAGCAREGVAGALLAQADIEGQRRWRRVVEADPQPHLIRALQTGLPAYGLYEGQAPMIPIRAIEWDNLEFGVLPAEQRGKSEAYQSSAMASGQVHGIRWRAHWTGIGIEREALFAAFQPLPIDERPTDITVKANEPVGAIKRVGEAVLARDFKAWVWAQLEQGCLPDAAQTHAFARSRGHTRKWAREQLKKLPPALRLSRGMRRQRPEIGQEQHAAYFAHFGPI